MRTFITADCYAQALYFKEVATATTSEQCFKTFSKAVSSFEASITFIRKLYVVTISVSHRVA